VAVTKLVTFATPYLTEKLKLGYNDLAQAVKQHPGMDDLSDRDVGLTLSFSEDRALTAVQSLFCFASFEAQETMPLTSQGRAWWGCDELPILVIEAGEYVRAYAQGAGTPAEVAMTALKSLSEKRFCLAYTEQHKGPYRVVHAPVMAVQKYKLRGVRRPTHLRVALTPVLYQGVYPNRKGFRAKPKDLHAGLIALSGAKPGRPPEGLLRLVSWLLTLEKSVTTVTEKKLAERLRVRTLVNGQPGKFREDLRQNFGILRALGLLENFTPPGLEDKGKWHLRKSVDLLRDKP
jgi:hypothetical protein